MSRCRRFYLEIVQELLLLLNPVTLDFFFKGTRTFTYLHLLLQETEDIKMFMFSAILLFAFCRGMEAFVVPTSNKDNKNIIQSKRFTPSQLHGFLDDILNFGKDDNAKNNNAKEKNEDEIDWNESDFQNELKKRNNEDIAVSVDSNIMIADDEEEEVKSKEFDGYMVCF